MNLVEQSVVYNVQQQVAPSHLEINPYGSMIHRVRDLDELSNHESLTSATYYHNERQEN